MSKFSTDLLVNEDGFGLYYTRVSDTLKSQDEISTFFKKLSNVESSYAKEVQKLSKSVNVKLWKKTEKEIGTAEKCWSTFHSELEKIGKLHEQLAERTNEVVVDIETWLKEKEKTKSKLNKDGQKLTKDFHDTMASLKAAKENYYKACKAADDAEAAYQKKKSEPTAKQKDVDKLNKKSIDSKEKAQNADGNYKKVLEKANEHQTSFYTSYMPSLLAEFQRFEEERTEFFRKVIQDYMRQLSTMPPALSRSCDALNSVVEAIDAQSDVNTFVAANRANAASIPAEIQYEPYDGAGAANYSSNITITRSSAGSTIPSRNSGPPSSSGGTQTKASSPPSKQWGLTGADSSLPQEEKRAKLEGQLKEIDDEIEAETNSKKGLDKLVKFYANDPVAQKKAVQESADQQKKIDSLKEGKNQISTQLQQINCFSEETSVSTTTNGEVTGEYDEESDYVEVKARALFDYDAANDTELGFKAGDILTVTEQDESGWWYAELSGKQGFVPNNYLSVIED